MIKKIEQLCKMKGQKLAIYFFGAIIVLIFVSFLVSKEKFSLTGCDINNIVNISDAQTICHNCQSQCSGDQLTQCYAAGTQEYNPSPACGAPPSGCNYNWNNDSYCGQCCGGCKKVCSTGDCTNLCSDPDRGNFDDCDCS